MAVLAIDQGTTSSRALRLDRDGGARITKVIEHRQSYPQADWVEHVPEELLRNVLDCARSGGEIEALALDNQGESCLAWDAETGEALSPVIVWQDSRTQDVIERMKAEGLEPQVLEAAGLPLDPYFSASKLAWLFEQLPEAKRRNAQGRLRLGTTDAFFLQRLTGRCVTDITTASRSSLMNIANGEWDPELCRLFGVPLEALPEIVSSTGDFGEIEVEGRKVPFRAAIVDQQAALYGHGCRLPGDAKVTFGTGAFALTVTGHEPLRAPDKGLLPTVAWRKEGEPATYALDGAVYSASAAVNWARALGLFSEFEQINAFEKSAAISRGIAFVPALAGLACPHWDRRARGAWLGLSLDSDSRDMVQAILEGVAFRTAEVIAAMAELAPGDSALSIDGGLAGNPYFGQFLSDALGRPLRVPEGGELTALGAALLAAENLGIEIAVREEARNISPAKQPAEWRARFSQALAASKLWGVQGPAERQSSDSG
jgi:glycerol kinase